METDSSPRRPHRGIVVSHTHWDRAWYLPFQTFRHRLVRLVDRLLDLLEDNPDYRAFTLDGQTILLEDYLDVRPDQEDRLRALIADDRLLIGPWYTLPDLFLVSGEAIIRNLQIGHDHCEDFGGAMPVGYIPDPFGHIAQMPQLLRGFGLDNYLFMRGMGREMKERLGALFNWRAPDGSTVRAVYQRQGYFPAAALGQPGIYGRFDGRAPTLDDAREQIQEAIDTMGPLQEQRTLLLSNGFDHMPEQPALPALLEGLNDSMDTIELAHGTLPQFIDELEAEIDDAADLPVYEGDLLGNADHPILQSVYSARLYLKRQNHRAQHRLTRVAEPVSAWLDAAGIGPDARPLLRTAWTTLLQNHPHDDICGCSVDPVHADNEVRYRHVNEISSGLLTEHLERLQIEGGFAAPSETAARHTDVWVFNPHPERQTHRVEATITIPNPDGERGTTPPPRRLAARADGAPVDVTVLDTEGDVMRCNYLEQTWGRRYEVEFEVEVPPLGYQLVHLYETDAPLPEAPSIEGPPALDNEHYRVTVADGGLRVVDKAGGQAYDEALQFVYDLDDGDTYSHGPVDHGPWWARLVNATTHPTRPDVLRLHHRLTVPAAYDRDDGPADNTILDLTTDVWLTPHRSVAVDVQYENTARDGRLRAVFPTGTSTRTAMADGHFRLAERTKPEVLTPEDAPERHSGYPGELPYPTQHQGDFVVTEGDVTEGDVHRTWIANRGSPEYELLWPEGDTHVAVTLHRAVGKLSVEGGGIRWCQAGPSIPTPGAQCQRALRAQLAFGTGPVSRTEAARHGRTFAHPAWARELPFLPHVDSDEEHPRAQAGLRLDNPAVELSALRPADEAGTRVLRLVNRSDNPQSVTATFGVPVAAACPTDFHEEWDADDAHPVTDDTLRLTLDPHQIRTILLR